MDLANMRAKRCPLARGDVPRRNGKPATDWGGHGLQDGPDRQNGKGKVAYVAESRNRGATPYGRLPANRPGVPYDGGRKEPCGAER
jgi:hypothetical protein